MNVISKVVVPFWQPWDAEPEATDAAISDLLNATPETPVLDHWGDRGELSAYELDQPDAVPEFAAFWQPSRPFSYRYLCFEAAVKVDEGAIRPLLERNNPGWKPKLPELHGLIHQLSAESAGQSVGHVLLAAQLAKPGAVSFEERVVVGPRRFARVDKGISLSAASAISRAERTGWPRISSLPIGEASQWLLGIPGLIQGDPRGPAGRAVSALANFAMRPVKPEGDPVGLMWCMVGLEALYGEGTAHLAQQLSQKSRAVLGEPEAFRKAVSKMYNVRSRFIHGDADFPLPYRYDEPDPAQFSQPMEEAVQLALGILIATVQRLIEIRRYHLAFEYRTIEA